MLQAHNAQRIVVFATGCGQQQRPNAMLERNAELSLELL
jgi:hypothetical protein